MIPRVVLTGGPCGGKTTAFTYLKERLPEMGITPIFVPEMATAMFQAGVKWLDIVQNEASAFRFQVQMIRSQIINEDLFFSFISLVPGRNKIMICDRGTVDNMVYSKDEWHEDILSQVGTLGYLKRRYDAIIHLNSLAYGDGYVQDNPARYENRDDAIKMDKRTWELWSRGPSVQHIRIAHNTSLNEKLEEVTQYVALVAKANG